MSRFLFPLFLIGANLLFAQVTLVNSFAENETVFTYTTDSEMFYISETIDNELKIFNSDFSVYKTINIPISSDYDCTIWYDSDYYPLISKYVFNTDDKFEFLVKASNSTESKLLLIDEDENLLFDFHPNSDFSFANYYEILHDPVNNNNKLNVRNISNISGAVNHDIYSLPTSSLSTESVESLNRFTAFPIPTSQTLNLINPRNGSNTIEVYDLNGKQIINKGFTNSDDTISLNVENLSKGTYIVKIGNMTSKFIKN